MRCMILAMALAALTIGTAEAGEPQSAFQTSMSRAHVPVTPKVTISSQNRRAGLAFNADGTLKTRKLPNGQTVGDVKKATGK